MIATGGCHAPFDENRDPVDNGTFGETVLTLACKRMAYLDDLANGGTVDVQGEAYRDICRLGLAPLPDASPTMKALHSQRDKLVASVDAIFPADFLTPLQTFLTNNEFLGLYDNETSTKAIDALIETLRHMADDGEAMAALERMGHRLGYRPLTPALGAVRAFVSYPELHELVETLTTAITPGGGARGEWENLVEAVGAAMRNASPPDNPDAADRTLRIALDFLLRERPRLGTSMQVPIVLRDTRGVAQVAGTTMPAPFVDTNNDGKADVDELGRFVDAAGAPIDAPAPFTLASDDVWQYRDPLGRALASDGGPLLYRYVDLDKTVLAAVARDSLQLFDPQKGTGLDLLRGASALVGQREEVTKTYANGETLTYRGYKTDVSPLLDLVYGYSQLLRQRGPLAADPTIYDTLALARTIMDNDSHSADVARLAEAVINAMRKGDNHPEAQVLATAPLWDDLVPVIRQILDRPQLVQALMTAMEKPETAQLGERFRKFLAYKDRFDINQQQAVVGAFATLVDRNAPDSAFNRSLFQRILHVISDSNGARGCNKQNAQVKDPFIGITLGTYNECQLFRIDNMAVFYLQSIAYAKQNGQYVCETDAGGFGDTTTASTPEGCVSQGRRPRPKADFNYNWGAFVEGSIRTFGGDKFLEDTVGIQGMRTHPTPNALNRVLFLDPMPAYLTNIIDPMRDREGDLYIAQHAGTLPVWEKDDFFAQLRPLVQAFADNDSEQLFVDLMVVLHKHWATPRSVTHQSVDPRAPGYVYGSSGMTYEPLMVDVLADGTLLGALQGTAQRLNTITVNGKSYEEVVRHAAAYFFRPQAGLADRKGITTSRTADNREITQLSPWHLLADAYQRKEERLAMAGAEGVAWQESVSEMVDVLARGVEVPQGNGQPARWTFRNPRMRGLSMALVDLVESRLRAHDQAGDRTQWLTQKLPADLEELLTSPVFAGAADFVLSLQATPETRVQIEKLTQYLVDEASSSSSFVTALTAVADVAQIALDDRDLLPIARVVGEVIRPERGWLEPQLVFVRDARKSDQGRALAQIMVNLYVEHRPGHTAIGDLIDGLSEVLRARPYDERGRYTAADYRAMLTGVAAFLDEEKRGLRKFISIIKTRNLSETP